MSVGVLRPHKDVEILRFEVGSVADQEVHVVVLHGVFYVHLEIQRFIDRPFFMRNRFDFAVVGLRVAAGEHQRNTGNDEEVSFHGD